MNQSYNEIIERMTKQGDGSISRKDAIANGIPPATFARYVQCNKLIKIRPGVYATDAALIDDFFNSKRDIPKSFTPG